MNQIQMERLATMVNFGLSDSDLFTALNTPSRAFKPSAGLLTFMGMVTAGVFGLNTMNRVAQLKNSLLQLAQSTTDLSTINPIWPSPGAFQIIHDQFSNNGVDLTHPLAETILYLVSNGIPSVMSPIMTPEEANSLLAMVVDLGPSPSQTVLGRAATEGDVVSIRSLVTRKEAANEFLNQIRAGYENIVAQVVQYKEGNAEELPNNPFSS